LAERVGEVGPSWAFLEPHPDVNENARPP
jgi:hypothetical protein